MSRTRTHWIVMVTAAALAAQPAFAQISEADRLARCQNNREALARAESAYRFYGQHTRWDSEEYIARARTALVSLRRSEAEYRRLLETASNIYNEELRPPIERMRQTGAAFGLFCNGDDVNCALVLPRALAREIDRAVAGQQPQQDAAREIARHRTNLLALNCPARDSVVRTGVGLLSGSWRSSFRDIIITISQDGNEISGRTSDGYDYGGFVHGNIVALTWTSNGGTGTQNGRISFDAYGRAVRIDFGATSWQRQ